MLPLGHMGISVAVIRIIESKCQLAWVDYRLLLVASLLPDLIDKPISFLSSDRYYGHSLLFLLLLFIGAVAQCYYWKNITLATICIGALSHDLLDAISHHKDWAERALFDMQMLLVFEAIGGCILLYFFCGLPVGNKIQAFIKNGKL